MAGVGQRRPAARKRRHQRSERRAPVRGEENRIGTSPLIFLLRDYTLCKTLSARRRGAGCLRISMPRLRSRFATSRSSATATAIVKRRNGCTAPSRRIAPLAGVVLRRRSSAALRPIFLDRAELPTSADLAASVREALSASRFLIVICSPAAAQSPWVNEEIRYFKSLGRGERVLALVVAGRAGPGSG